MAEEEQSSQATVAAATAFLAPARAAGAEPASCEPATDSSMSAGTGVNEPMNDVESHTTHAHTLVAPGCAEDTEEAPAACTAEQVGREATSEMVEFGAGETLTREGDSAIRAE